MTIAPAFATHNGTGEADSSASTGTGLFNLLDTGKCTAIDTATTATGSTSGRCGTGINLNNQVGVFDQTAAAPGDGTSTATAHVAPIDLTNIAALDINGILNGLLAPNTGTVLDSVINALSPTLQTVLKPLEASVTPALTQALQTALGSLTQALPISISIGAVNSTCSATGSPLRATGTSSVAGAHLSVQLGSQSIIVPLQVGTAPNSNLLIGAPQDLVNSIISSLEATFTQSLGSALAPLNQVLSTLQQQVTDQIFSQLEAQLLPAVANALAPIVKGTVNEQNPVSPSSTGEIEVTALDLTVLGTNNLKLARTHCGPDRVGTPHGVTPTPAPQPSPGPGPGPSNIPTAVDSGMAGNSHQGVIIAATGALLVAAGVTGLAGYRRMLQK